jgi:HPt (histidine-containing phosphotransfer) domain-containing protein
MMANMDKVLVRVPAGLPPKLVADYLANCRNSLRSLKEALAGKDYDYLRVFGHRMKGCGGAYGFPQLTDTGVRMERWAVARNDRELLDEAAALEQYLSRVEIAAG